MKQVAIYARVSTERQEREKTIDSQLEELRTVCSQNQAEIVNEYIDNGFSGGTLVRPALDKLRDDASKGLFGAVYVHSPDRLARRYVYQALVLEELKKKKIEVIFLNKPVTDNPEDQLLLGMQGLIAEYERAKIIERTRRGRLHKARNGNIMGGTGPYGYDYIHKTLEKGASYKINPEEAEIVRLIFSLYIKHQSTGEVVRELKEREIRPRCGSEVWSKGLIHRILCNECYIGNAYYNKRDKSGNQCKPRERGEWISIKVPPILNEETYHLTQEILRSHAGGKKPRTFLLSSLVKCKDCGSKYVGSNRNREYYYYRCGNILKRFPLPKTCNARTVKAEQLEGAVLHRIQKAILKPHILINHIIDLADKVGDQKELKRAKEKLLTRKEKLEKKRKRLINLYSEEHISEDEYVEMEKEVDSKKRGLQKEILEIESRISNKIDKSLIIKNIDHFSRLARERIGNFTPDKAQEFLRYLVKEIIYDSHERTAHIIGFIPIVEDGSTGQELFPIAPTLSGETSNKKLRFEMKIKV